MRQPCTINRRRHGLLRAYHLKILHQLELRQLLNLDEVEEVGAEETKAEAEAEVGEVGEVGVKKGPCPPYLAFKYPS